MENTVIAASPFDIPVRPCTCHPDDEPPKPCARKYALSECRAMQHTPGPWRVVRQNPSPTTGEWMISGARPGYLAEVRDCGSGDVRANAELIASAPDLLIENMKLKAAIERMRCAGGSVEFQMAFELAKDLLHNADRHQLSS